MLARGVCQGLSDFTQNRAAWCYVGRGSRPAKWLAGRVFEGPVVSEGGRRDTVLAFPPLLPFPHLSPSYFLEF